MNEYTKKQKKTQVDLVEKIKFKNLNKFELAKFIKYCISEKGYSRLLECSSWLHLISDSIFEKKKVVNSNKCGNRFCSVCAWIKSCKDSYMIRTILKYINKEYKKEFIFVTLTSVNVTAENLSDEINKFNKAFKKFINRTNFKNINKGYVRKLEITYNQEMNTYNPHFHIIFAVNKSYFTDKSYINHEKWLTNWQECMDDDRITQVDVRRVYNSNNSNAVKEVSKYSAKDSDYLYSAEVFNVFYNALKGRQLITYNGLFKDAVKLYKLKDITKNLDNYKDIDNTEYTYFMKYLWKDKMYFEKECRPLTREEIEKYNKKYTEEIKKTEND